MKNINVWIKENIENIGSSVFIVEHPNEKMRPSEKKLNNAIKAFNCEGFQRNILAIQDATIFGGADEGFVFTGERMIHHRMGTFYYKDIEKVEHIVNITVNDKGKENKDEYLEITKSGKIIRFSYLSGINLEKFSKFINTIIQEFNLDEIKEEDQLKTLAEMPEEVKIAYMKIIINKTFDNDNIIDEKELSEILVLMTNVNLDTDSRFILRAYITEITSENIECVEDLINIIKADAEPSHHKSLMISLVKDLINVDYSTSETKSANFDFLNKNRKLFDVSEEEINLAFTAVENDYKLIREEDIDDDVLTKNMKELASKAASVGVPLGAVYISGSVIGMSAAGITSGLATLGMGGILGLSSMATGIGVAVLIGVGVYKGMQHLTGANKISKYATRSLMLQDALKQTQKTISLVIEDINYLVKQLNKVMTNHNEQNEKIQKLERMISLYAGALKNTDNTTDLYQNKALKLNCPDKIDEVRLKTLTDEPTKKQIYDFVMNNYDKDTLKIKDNIETEILEKMNQIFKVIGYFDMSSTVKGLASEGLQKIKGIF